ncbi:MAG: response regulator, partial [Oscillospiraceae bacterium]|nr:response regulator [Oscillospiraceae bacterium]
MLAIELVFTITAFAVMVVLNYRFMHDAVRDSLIRHADSVLDSAESQVTKTLRGFEVALGGFTEEINNALLRGDSADELRAYIGEVSRHSFLDGETSSGIQDFFGYFETLPGGPVLIQSGSDPVPAGYKPEEQDWYRAAVEADGGIAETVPAVSGEDETVYTYSMSFSDKDGNRLGVACMNVNVDQLGQSVVETALNQNGYGMLLNQNGEVLFHPNPKFRGMDIHDPGIPIYIYAEAIINGENIFEQPMISYNQEESVIFFRTLHNRWHLGLVTPEKYYYQSVDNVRYVLILAGVIGVVLAIFLITMDRARKKSDSESRQKSIFLANMSHEIRTPINAIVGMTAIGKTVGAVERKDYCFSKIDDASRHLLGVINDILDLSKIEANKIELSPTDFNFEKMLQQVVNVVNFRVDEKHQKLSVYIDKNIPKVLYADDQRFAQILTNLLSNAVKFSPNDSAISLNTQLLSLDNGEYTIQTEVRDEGIGISQEQQTKLFQSFQQAESSTTRSYGGTGLGLSISKSIVALMGGKIWVTSELGQGSTFAFTVKVRLGDHTKYGLAQQDVNWGNVRILTVDDDRDILEYFHEIIKEFGANCEVAADAGEALHMVDETGEYNIYFIDLKMPGVDGIALTKEIRAREKNPGHSIVIMISSADLSVMEEDARKAGVDRFLLKPIFPSSIADVINDCIGITNEKARDLPVDIRGIFEGYRILFAEDVAINFEIVQTLLEPTLVSLECAENGAEAVRMFIRDPEKYDLIFMDVQMPIMDGYEATRQIRALEIP